MVFQSEKQMSYYMYEYLKDNFNNDCIDYFWEFEGLFGRPDYLIVEKGVNSLDYTISIELKLKNWNQALKQAFRYRNFSNESYVVLDSDCIENTLKYISHFKKYNVGLASFNKSKELKIYFHPKSMKPFSSYFTKIVEDEVIFGSNSESNEEFLNLNCNSQTNILYDKFRELNAG